MSGRERAVLRLIGMIEQLERDRDLSAFDAYDPYALEKALPGPCALETALIHGVAMSLYERAEYPDRVTEDIAIDAIVDDLAAYREAVATR